MGRQGEVLAGAVRMVEPELTGDFAKVMEWADGARRMKVRANADSPEDARVAVKFGAEGIGLCRTEHMFFNAERIAAVREMILAETAQGRVTALAKLLPFQRDDFLNIFRVMGERPVTIRFLDPPLHEFFAAHGEGMRRRSEGDGAFSGSVARARGGAEGKQSDARLPRVPARDRVSGIYEMQARAVFEAAAQIHDETGKSADS